MLDTRYWMLVQIKYNVLKSLRDCDKELEEIYIVRVKFVDDTDGI